MVLSSKYQFDREGGWNLWMLPERWSEGLWSEIHRHLSRGLPTGHPQTERFYFPAGENGREFYLKIHYGSRLLGTAKDLFRDSKALRALKQGEALSGRGFHVPLAVAAGEERSFGCLKRAFLLTLGIKASPLSRFVRERSSLPFDLAGVLAKREYLKQLAVEVRRLHQAGFLHGDLVPSNILVRAENGQITFFYMDHDRTRRYPVWLPHGLWKRNLVQLNRFVLPRISLQDRMRFLRFYLGKESWGKRERRLIYWLEKKTRQRRLECDRIEAHVSFRELMRWDGPFSRSL